MNVREIYPLAFVLALLPAIACTQILGIDKDYVETSGKTTGTGAGGKSSSSTTDTTGGSGGTTAPPISCNTSIDCPGAENECAHRTCDKSVCGVSYSPRGTVLGAQNAGDCRKIVCDGNGVPEAENDDGDVPEDSNPCTLDLCDAGVPSHGNAAMGLTCGNNLSCDGNGNCAGCMIPSDCPGQDTDCQTRACTSGICGFVYSPAGTPVMAQTGGDCKLNACNGMGQISIIAFPTDPEDDGNPCTTDACSNGSPTHSNAAAGAPCSAGGGNVCNGSGSCVQCLVPENCPGQNDECKTRACNGGACGMNYAPAGTVVSFQSGGDCRQNVCDGSGGVTTQPDSGDGPDDGNPCTNDGCSGGNPVFNPAPQGTGCGPNKTCNGQGQCVGCITAGDCPGQDNECQSRQCNGGGVCGMNYVPPGTPAGPQAGGDCLINVCNGSGSIVTVPDDGDVSDDGDPCTSEYCSGGTLYHPPAPVGTGCPGGVCNGAGGCGVCYPGQYASCCWDISYACCYMWKQGGGEAEGDNTSDETPDNCCCEGYQDCDSSGQWGYCY